MLIKTHAPDAVMGRRFDQDFFAGVQQKIPQRRILAKFGQIALYHHGSAHLVPNDLMQAGARGVTARVRLPLYQVAQASTVLPYRPPLMPGGV